MPSSPPPNDAIADLANLLGADNFRTLVSTFLRDFPASFKALSEGDRKNQHRIAHSLKSTFRLMGAYTLSERMTELEDRLAPETGPGIASAELVAIKNEFALVEISLRTFAEA